MSSNNPPPWLGITGISRADMKDNAQVSVVQYDGNARPGELVVEQTALNLFAGNNDGNLVLLANANATKFYGNFIDTVTQTNTNVGNAIPVLVGTTLSNNHVSINNGSEITIDFTGVYNIQFSLQVHKTDAGSDTIYIWLSKNGTAVPDTNTGVTLQGLGESYVAAWNFVVDAIAGDFYQLMWGSVDSAMQLLAVSSPPIGPAIPSVILTVTQV